MIPINFASRNFRRIAQFQGVLTAVSAALCITLIGMLWTTASLRRHISAMDGRLKGLEAADENIRMELRERDQLVKDLSRMSSLMEPMRFSWIGLLTSLETAVPLGVAFKQVSYNPQDRSLTLEGEARSPEALRNLVVNLEKSASFKNPILKHQSINKGINLFDVVVVYSENAGPAVAPRIQ